MLKTEAMVEKGKDQVEVVSELVKPLCAEQVSELFDALRARIAALLWRVGLRADRRRHTA